jgi:anti-sigma B factor antagonist
MPRRSKKPQGRPRFATANGDQKPAGFSVMVAEGINGGAVVTMLGELDLASAPELRKVLDAAIDYGGDVEVDMRACGFVDSMGIAAIVGAARQLAERGKVLHIKGAQERVRKIFELAGLVDNDWIELES